MPCEGCVTAEYVSVSPVDVLPVNVIPTLAFSFTATLCAFATGAAVLVPETYCNVSVPPLFTVNCPQASPPVRLLFELIVTAPLGATKVP